MPTFKQRRDARRSRCTGVTQDSQKAESLLAEAFTLCTLGRPLLGEPVSASLQIVDGAEHVVDLKAAAVQDDNIAREHDKFC